MSRKKEKAKIIQLAVAADADGNDQLFVLSNKGVIYERYYDVGYGKYVWMELAMPELKNIDLEGFSS